MASTGFLTAQTVMKEFPNTEVVNEFEKERAKLSVFYARLAEECERKRRISEEATNTENMESMVSRAWAKLVEAEERLDRMKEILNLKEFDKLSKEVHIEAKTPIAPSSASFSQQLQKQQEELDKDASELDRAYTIIHEEQERARRIAEDSYLEEVEEEHRADNRAYATIKEEEEKNRRIAELSVEDEKQQGYREELKAYTIIQEEQERARRIAADSYLDDLSLKDSLNNRKLAAQLEEKERQRRMKEKPGASQLANLKVNAHIIATHCERFHSGKKPKVAMFSKPKKLRRDLTTELEDKEKRRRIQNPLSSEQLGKLREISLMAALAQTRKTSGQEVVINKFKKASFFKDAQVRLNRIKDLEEEARCWKMSNINKISKQDKLNLKKISMEAAECGLKKLGSKTVIVSKYKKPDQTKLLEEKERTRRLKEKLTPTQLDQLRKIAEIAADNASKKISGRKLPITKMKVTKKPSVIESRDSVKQAEEKERRRRMANPLTPKQFLQLKSISNMAATASTTKFALRKKKRPATYKKPVAMKKDVTKSLEEKERQRRISEKPSTEQLDQLKKLSHTIADSAGKKLSGQKLPTTTFKKTPVVEVERKRRTLHKPELLTKLRTVAHNVKESVESRLAGQRRLPSRFKKTLLKGLETTRRLEEEERQRRMTEKITPEQRNRLRIFSHQVVDEVVNKQRGKLVKPKTFKKAEMKGFSKLQQLEEQERQRRISEKPSTEQLQKLKSIAETVSKAAVTKQQQKKKPTYAFKKYKLTETIKRSRGLISKMEENERQRRLANPPSSEQLAQLSRMSRTIVNEANKKLQGQKLTPTKFAMNKPVKGKRLARSLEHKRSQFRLFQTKNFPLTAKSVQQQPQQPEIVEQKTTTTKTEVKEEPFEVRKNVVEKLSHEMFSKIRKTVVPERR